MGDGGGQIGAVLGTHMLTPLFQGLLRETKLQHVFFDETNELQNPAIKVNHNLQNELPEAGLFPDVGRRARGFVG